MDELSLRILKAQKHQFPFHRIPVGLKFSKLFYQSSYKYRVFEKEGIKHIYMFCFSFRLGYLGTLCHGGIQEVTEEKDMILFLHMDYRCIVNRWEDSLNRLL